MRSLPHIAVCICTFKRPELLPELFRELARQRTDARFTYEIVIADNDCAMSAEQTVRECASVSQVRVTYCVEPEVNIARARNRSVAHASGDFVAFIDDDEVPASDWLYTLFETRERHGVDGVLGPVIARFQQPPPHGG